MQYVNIRGKAGRISRESTITAEQLKSLLDAANTQEKVIIVGAGYCNLRESELTHMIPSWLHFDKSETKAYGCVPYIHVVGEPQKCNCVDCQLRAYIQYRKQKENEKIGKRVKHDSKWYQKVSHDFYQLKPTRKPPDNEMSRVRKFSLYGYWKPKSKSSVRDIPLSLPHVQEIMLDYKTNYSKMKLSKNRIDIWRAVSDLGHEVLGEETHIFPHALRATYATILGKIGNVSLVKVKSLMGHANASTTDLYINSEGTEAVLETIRKSKDIF